MHDGHRGGRTSWSLESRAWTCTAGNTKYFKRACMSSQPCPRQASVKVGATNGTSCMHRHGMTCQAHVLYRADSCSRGDCPPKDPFQHAPAINIPQHRDPQMRHGSASTAFEHSGEQLPGPIARGQQRKPTHGSLPGPLGQRGSFSTGSGSRSRRANVLWPTIPLSGLCDASGTLGVSLCSMPHGAGIDSPTKQVQVQPTAAGSREGTADRPSLLSLRRTELLLLEALYPAACRRQAAGK